MLQVKDVSKIYQIGNTTTKALDGISIAFRKNEFVAILGPSGSGKTTLLNIIGGLDKYNFGDVIINGQSTKTFREQEWDAYRNNSIGFIFQNYNLINHQGIIENVELGMTLSGVSKSIRRKKAKEALVRVGLKEHMYKKPNQLSGGQMQRVAIARALVNDPDILLCDEPTGALDSETSIQIMELIQELSNEKLVIMVTHNPQLAETYASRIIELTDGKITMDSSPYTEQEVGCDFQLKRTKMTFITALRLSLNNIGTKKGRTLLTAFASSIGIISIAIILALATGFQKQISNAQSELLALFPVMISKVIVDDNEMIIGNADTKAEAKPSKEIVAQTSVDQQYRINKLDNAYLDYVSKMDPEWSHYIGFDRFTSLNVLRKVDGQVRKIQFSDSPSNNQEGLLTTYLQPLNKSENHFLQDNYDLLAGNYPKNEREVVLIVDNDGTLDLNILKNMGYDVKNNEKLSFSDIVGTTFTVALNDAFYTKLSTGNFVPNKDLEAVFNHKDNEQLIISGILTLKPEAEMGILENGIVCSDHLLEKIIEKNSQSEIVKAQKHSKFNLMTNEVLDQETKEELIAYLGGSAVPADIRLYPVNFDSKDKMLAYLDKYNKGKKQADKIIYTDSAKMITDESGGVMLAVTGVLIAFTSISLMTSMIMIGIITYTSIIERTKEIGILKALGARKKDITRVFVSETVILGVSTGVLGVGIAYLIIIPINMILEHLTELEHVALLEPSYAGILIAISAVLTMLGGYIPARIAAKKDAAIALRSE